MSAPATASPSFKSKALGWLSKVTSPSTTHASSMLLILGFLAASSSVNAESVVSSHHDDAVHPADASASSDEPLGAEAKPVDRQELFYYMAMGMLVSQGMLRLLTWYQNRREAQAAAARKKDDDYPQGPSKEVLDFVNKDLGSDDDDSDDDDYEEEESEESSDDDEEEEDEDEEEEEDDIAAENESESESELERRRRLLAVGDAEVEE
ncbi:hypothetical protein BGZ73_006903 [Actinomortierella ambigua]|nr:hypothetical protein BGZ73_006903 [Actinomortierella ambigua]